MFQKPTFGSTTSGFGSFNATPSTSSPFGGFKPQATTSAFGAAPAFGASAAPQPAQTGSFFGAPAANTSGLFGSTAPAASSSFGAPASSGFGFGGGAGGGLFGGQAAGGGLFGTPQQQTTSAFGAKPAGFGFGSTPAAATASTGVFGAAAPAPSLFAPAQNTAMGGGGLFSNTAAARGTAHVKYNPVVGTDVMVKSGTSQNINIKHHCITCMKEYESKSLEELRLEDYLAGNKGAPAAAGVFGAAKPLFGGSTAFGQPATTAAQPTSVFGGGGFGQTTMGQNSTFAFGASTQPTNSSTNLFGANKPAFGATATPGTTGLFGAATTQAPAFGATNTSTSFGFGANTQNQSTGLFGAKPATTGFGAPAASGFGSFSSGGLFANKPATATAQPAPAFGAAAPAFGAPTSTAGSLFGNSAFGKPAQPSFGFGSQPTTGLGGGLGGGLGATSFQAKPGGGFPSLNTSAPSLFGGQANTTLNFNTETASRCYSVCFQAKPGGGFPSLNTSAPSLFGGQANTTLNFNTGGSTGLGGGLGGGLNFGNTSTLGQPSLGLGNTNPMGGMAKPLGGDLGGGLNFGNTSTLGNPSLGLGNTNPVGGMANTTFQSSSSGANVHEQILTLAARPYGDWPLFKDLVPEPSEYTASSASLSYSYNARRRPLPK
ncbi:hypothetical protein JYU34_008196 [Plutella xylostella]|uniref:Nuclear pore complex protein Nup98-Nup96 n=1 Tax=Plutella xylostella TaxID=51655 RepID=A0ABQ7QP03_PLUXY|nr:hypothetical protein JYU34_008196 [Plutella xylostella]